MTNSFISSVRPESFLDRERIASPERPDGNRAFRSDRSDEKYRFSVRELVLAVRPHQWIKNALVMLGPILSGSVLHPPVLIAGVVAVVAFCAASAATYLVNDVADVDSDKLHPTKQLRPIAAGTLSVDNARIAAIMFGSAALGLAIGVGPLFAAVLISYLVKTTIYSLRLKLIPVVDVIAIASGFVLRVVAGAVAVGTGVSLWLLGAVAAGAVLISLGKRHAEVGRLGVDAGDHRAVLDWYRPARTERLMIVAEITAIIATARWFFAAFGTATTVVAVATVMVILERFRRLVLAGDVDDPVRVISHDRPIAGATLLLGLVLFAGLAF